MATGGSQAHNQDKFLRPLSDLIGNFWVCVKKVCSPKHSVGPFPVRQLLELLSLITVRFLKIETDSVVFFSVSVSGLVR